MFPQIIYEFWAVGTRSAAANGLGLSAKQVSMLIEGFLSQMPLLFDNPTVFERWQELVARYAVTGVNSHDMRIVASMLTHQVPALLTLNRKDFSRYIEIEVLVPDEVIASTPPSPAE